MQTHTIALLGDWLIATAQPPHQAAPITDQDRQEAAGVKAKARGFPLRSNPYRRAPELRPAWSSGWRISRPDRTGNRSPERPPATARGIGLAMRALPCRALISQDRGQPPPFVAFLVQTAAKVVNLVSAIRQKHLLRPHPFAQDRNLLQQPIISTCNALLRLCCVPLHFGVAQVLQRNGEHAMQFCGVNAPCAIDSLGC